MQRRAVQPERPLHYCTWINTHNTASSNQAATTDAGEAGAKAGSAGWRPLTEGIRLDKYTRSQPAEAEARSIGDTWRLVDTCHEAGCVLTRVQEFCPEQHLGYSQVISCD